MVRVRAYRSTFGRKQSQSTDDGVWGLLWLDTGCFVNHVLGSFGNSGNGVITGPGLNTTDLMLMKNTYVSIGSREPLNVQFRAEFFNAFNHPVFNDPNLAAGTAQFGTIRGTRVGGREIQLALKVLF